MSTRNSKARAIRQEAYRELLSSQGHLQHVIDLLNKIETEKDMDPNTLARLKVVVDSKFKIINKFLPDLKSTEVTGEGGGAVHLTQIERIVVKAKNTNG